MYLTRERKLRHTLMVCVLGLLGCLMYGENPKAAIAVHRRTEFTLEIKAPLETVVPLFGADKEHVWAEGWNPQFVHPQPANDEAGAVFTTRTGHSSVWINTIYDLKQGHVQYACFAREGMVTLIDIRVLSRSAISTRAVVVYERTALQPEANEYVNGQADSDATKGPEWEAAMQNYLQSRSKQVSGSKRHD
jgi:hypothetical protein